VLFLLGPGQVSGGLGDVTREAGGRRLVLRVEPGRPAGQRREVGFGQHPRDPALDQPLGEAEGRLEVHRARLRHPPLADRSRRPAAVPVTSRSP
jgi:hypothetical protein